MIKLLKHMKKKEWIMAGICMVLVLGQVYFELTMPDYMSDLTVMVQTPGYAQSEVWDVGLRMLGCALAAMALTIIGGWFSAQVAAGFSYSIRSEVFEKISNFGKEEMDRFSVPSLVIRTTNDIRQVQMLLAMGLQILVKAPVMAIWAVIKIVGKSWELSLLTAICVVILISAMLTVLFLLLPRFKRVQKLTDDINRIARENLNGISVVHAFNAEGYQEKKFKAVNDNLTKIQLFNQHAFAFLSPVMTLAMSGLSLAIFWFGAYLIENIAMPDVAGRLGLFGDVVVFGTYATYVVMSLMLILMIFMFIPAAQVSAGRIDELLNTEISIWSGKENGGIETGTVEFKNVSFRYPDSSNHVLKNISFRVKCGDTVAFIGATGSGKTTLVSLIARFYDATDGQVLIDGRDIREYTFEALYRKIGYVTQKAVMFSGTVRDNVLFGESNAVLSDDNVWQALQLAQAMEFVEKMPGKLDEAIDRGGTNISGGQKQRLSIARALARKPEILVFDDSFSALDYKTDAVLRAGLARELKNTTKIIVGQRIGTIRHADKIIVLEHGEVAGMGTHEELIKNCPVYCEIAKSQLSEQELLA